MGSELDLNDVAFGHRIATEELAQLRRAERERDELLAALKYHQEQTRPIQQTIDLIAKVQS